jgi:hypothetical protein
MVTDKPRIGYWHLWADEKGVSHQTRCTIEEFELKSIQPGTNPQWQGRKSTGRRTTLVTVLPVGWVGTWHENPRPQWIIPLAGRWYVEAMDGSRTEMGPGELAFGADQNCAELDGKRGHQSGTVGNEPAVLMIVQFDDEAPLQPCGFR